MADVLVYEVHGDNAEMRVVLPPRDEEDEK